MNYDSADDYDCDFAKAINSVKTVQTVNDFDEDNWIANADECMKSIFKPFDNTDASANIEFAGIDYDDIDDESYCNHCPGCIFNPNLDVSLKAKIINLIRKIDYDSATYADMIISNYFKKYISIHSNCYKYIKTHSIVPGNPGNPVNSDINSSITKITFTPRSIENFPFSKSDLLEFAQHHILSVSFDIYSAPGATTTISNLLPGGKTVFLDIFEYNGTLENLPLNIKFLSVAFNPDYQQSLIPNNNINRVPDENPATSPDYNETDRIAKIKCKNERDIMQYGNLMLHEGLNWLFLRNMDFVNVASLPASLKGFIFENSSPSFYYYRDFINFPSSLEVLGITICNYTTLVCPGSLKVLSLETETIANRYSEFINITIPDTLERLRFRDNTEYLKVLLSATSSIKSLDIQLNTVDAVMIDETDETNESAKLYEFELLEKIIPLNLEELIINSGCAKGFGANPSELFPSSNYPMDLLINIISKLHSLKLLIIQINEDELINDFESIFREKLSSIHPNYESLKIYIIADLGDGFHDNIMASKCGYCECCSDCF
jgi:hypothetical protein